VQELDQILRRRLETSGEKLAETTRNWVGRSWRYRSFDVDREYLPPGYTGVELIFGETTFGNVEVLSLYVEIA
jgi:hypothetical protein